MQDSKFSGVAEGSCIVAEMSGNPSEPLASAHHVITTDVDSELMNNSTTVNKVTGYSCLVSLTSPHFTQCLAATLPVTSSAAPEGRSSGSPDWLSLQLLCPLCPAL